MVRLSKRIAQAGQYSRREADRLISDGRVLLNGEVAVPGTKVPLAGGEIIVDGTLLGERSIAVYKFHKPKGILSSYYDPNGKQNLSSFKSLANNRMGYSGRLDYDSEGLMLFTSKGDLIYQLQRSEYEVEKEYIVEVDKDISQSETERLREGIIDRDEHFLPCIVEFVSTKRYRVILTEGKKHQVRRMFRNAGSTVERLVRVRIGTIHLNDLQPGVLQELTEKEIEELKTCIK